MHFLRCWLIATALAVSIQAAERPAFAFGTRDGKVIEHAIPEGTSVDVIIEFRDTPRLRQAAAQSAQAAQAFEARFDQFSRDLTQLAEEPAIRHRYSRVFSGVSVRVRRQSIAAIEALSYVAAVHIDERVRLFETSGASRALQAASKPRRNTSTPRVVVAVIDTGVDYRHPALGGAFGPSFKVTGGWDFANDDADPLDDHGHGTHVSAIIAGDGGGVIGVAPDTLLLAYKVLDSSGSGLESDVIAAVERAVDPDQDGDPRDHADVANMSLGFYFGSADNPMTRAVENASAAGVVFCVAAGNRSDFFTVASPGDAPSAITVGAIDHADAIAPFSSKGPLHESMRIKPDLVAPGVDISSAWLGGGVTVQSGTSMAAPYVAGVAARVKASHPEWLAPAIRSAVVNTARGLGNEPMIEGAGKVDGVRAISADVVASPAVISFGNSDRASDVWTASREVTISNPSTSVKTLAVSITGERAGVDVTCAPSALTLAPGESRVVTVQLNVRHPELFPPEEGSLSFGGVVAVEGAAIPIRIPWAAGKAALLALTSDEAFNVVAASTKTFHYQIGNKRAAINLPVGTYDIIVRSGSIATVDARLMILEQQTIDGVLRVDVAAEQTPHEVIFDTKDAVGIPLSTSSRVCVHYYSLELPDDSHLAWYSTAQYGGSLRVSPFSSRIVLRPAQDCRDASTRTSYVLNLPPIHGLSGTVTRSLPSSEWIHVPIRVLPPPGATSTFMTQGSVINTTLTGQSFFDLVFELSTLFSGVWNGMLVLSPEQPSLFISAIPHLFSIRPGADETTAPAITSAILRVLDGQVIPSFEETPPPYRYRVPPGSTLTLGDAPVLPQAFFGQSPDFLHAQVFWFGPVGEERVLDSLLAQTAVLDSAGNVIRTNEVSGPLPGAGEYRVRMVNTNFTVSGVRATATYDARFDTRVSAWLVPLFRALRVIDGNGIQASRIVAGSTARIVLAADFLQSARIADAVLVQARAHDGNGAWQTVPSVAQEVSPGSAMVVADLATKNLLGLIDLRFSVEGNEGVSVEYTVEPALSVITSERRRSARH